MHVRQLPSLVHAELLCRVLSKPETGQKLRCLSARGGVRLQEAMPANFRVPRAKDLYEERRLKREKEREAQEQAQVGCACGLGRWRGASDGGCMCWALGLPASWPGLPEHVLVGMHVWDGGQAWVVMAQQSGGAGAIWLEVAS